MTQNSRLYKIYIRRMCPDSPSIKLLPEYADEIDIICLSGSSTTSEEPFEPYKRPETYNNWSRPGLKNEPGGLFKRFKVPYFYRFTYTDASKATTGIKFTRSGQNLIDSEDQVDRHLDILKYFKDNLPSADETSEPFTKAVLIGEHDKVKGFGVQKGKNLGWWLPTKQASAVTVPDRFKYIIRYVLKLYDKLIQKHKPVHEFKPPLDTSSGWPPFISGPAGKFISAGLYSTNYNEMMDLGYKFANKVGLPEESVFASGVNPRVTATSKELPLFVLSPNGLMQVGKAQNAIPRNRQTWMSPYAFSMSLRRLALRLKQGRHACGLEGIGLWHDKECQAKYMPWNYKYTEESDFSGYDLSVSKELQHEVMLAISEVWPDLAEEARTWFALEQMPYIGPDWLGEDGYGTLVSKRGQTSSGLILTSDIGTLIAFAAALYAFERALSTTAEKYVAAVIKKQEGLAILGDDLLRGGDKPTNQVEFVVAMAELGLVAEIIPSCRFLSKYVHGAEQYPIWSRCQEQTYFPERPPSAITHEAKLTLTVIGFAARYSATGPPDVANLKDLGTKCFKMSLMYELTGVFDYESANRWLSRNRAMVMKVLEEKHVQSWVERTLREAEYNTAAADVAQYLATEIDVDSLRVKAISFENGLYKKMWSYLALDIPDRFNIAVEMFDYLTRQYHVGGFALDPFQELSRQITLINHYI